jgi:chorismate synthase
LPPDSSGTPATAQVEPHQHLLDLDRRHVGSGDLQHLVAARLEGEITVGVDEAGTTGGVVAIAVAALVQRQHAVLGRQIEAHQVPGMTGLVAAMKQHHRQRLGIAPPQVVEPLTPTALCRRNAATASVPWVIS